MKRTFVGNVQVKDGEFYLQSIGCIIKADDMLEDFPGRNVRVTVEEFEEEKVPLEKLELCIA